MERQAVHSRRWLTLSVLIISLVAIVLDNTILNIALKTISEPRVGLGASQSPAKDVQRAMAGEKVSAPVVGE